MRRNTPFTGPRQIAGRHVLATGNGGYRYLGQEIERAPGSTAWAITWAAADRDGTDSAPSLSDALARIESVVGGEDRTCPSSSTKRPHARNGHG